MDKQGIIVIGLILLAWMGYQRFVYAPQVEAWRQAEERRLDEERKQRPADGRQDDGTAPVETATPPPGRVEAPPRVEEHPLVRGIPFETPEHAITLTSAGGALEALTFKNVLDTTYVHDSTRVPDHDDRRARVPLQVHHPYPVPNVRSFAVEPLRPDLLEAARGTWAHEPLEGGRHRFSLLLPNGVRLIKTYSPPPAPAAGQPPRYHFDLTVEVENTTSEPVEFGYRLLGPAGMVDESGDARTAGQQAVMAVRPERKVVLETLAATDAARLDAPDRTVGRNGGVVTYFGTATKYFASVVVPREAPVASASAQGLLQAGAGRLPADKDEPDGLAHQALAWGTTEVLTLEPGARRADAYMVYVGPKQKAVFEDEAGPYHGFGLEKLIDYGWFESMARVLLSILGLFHAIVGNWGVAIILLTFLVRSLLLPLSIWSQKNMLRMQKLAPEMNRLKEKYTRKDGSMTPEAQRQFSAEQMDLMRKAGVNPVGCLGPIFLQLPVFIGLWNALNYSVDLRGQPLGLWITDLSVPDVLFRLPFAIPFLGNAFSVLPLVMIFTYWLQQQMQPKATDPKAAEQQRMMKMIIPFFGVLLYTAPSGLMLYFITSSFWSIAEQKWVKKHIEKTEGPVGGAAVPMMG
ncbi:MAG: YidC/Oxa1 family insertase periplasmic-domain containing protein [Planctomycetes bacterium]|nr:YidC/Oxa1 family insertase periplasmic-domain containing protein [Planctomycetota bacterium]